MSTSHSLSSFLTTHADQDRPAAGPFEVENRATLQVNLQGTVYAKAGAMVATLGDVKFSRKGALEDGVGKFLKKAVTGEGMTLMKMEGNGRVYLADRNKRVHLLALAGESLCVNGNDLLALHFDKLSANGRGLDWDIVMLKSVAGALAGGLFNVQISGTGLVAITTHGDPLVLPVTAARPVHTDPQATVAWSGQLQPDIHTDISLGTLVGRSSGESVQMRFKGEGWVMVQPYEETAVVAGR
jgi:uncharacterized protein (AIM24 family)